MRQKTTMKNQQASRNIISKRSTLFLCICSFMLDYSSPKGTYTVLVLYITSLILLFLNIKEMHAKCLILFL
ncbi:hypothetical protein Hdeb2414_s0069g00770721 [Helianthus debilis subsp. tardiflorus]